MRRRLLVSIVTLPFLVLLGLVAAGAATAGGGCHGGTGATASTASSTVVRIDGCTFQPTVNQVPVGVLVTFLNASGGPHDVTGGSGGWRSPLLDGGASYTHRFTEPGVYPYSCSLHPGMAGVVVVGPADVTLASDIEVAPSQPATSAAGGSPIPVVLAGGLGLVAGTLGAGALVRRRDQSHAE